MMTTLSWRLRLTWITLALALVGVGRGQDAGMPFIGGVGGVYFLAGPGELVIEVEKRELNRRDATCELRAILAGPDRDVIQEIVIGDDGRPRGSGLGPVQSCRFAVSVARRGVYVLNITVSNDRYGEEVVWRIRTNCAKYLIETARGHKDARHEEPIVLASPEQPGEVCFSPRRGPFAVGLSRLPKNATAEILDVAGKAVATLRADAKGEARYTVAADAARGNGPWRVRLSSAQATLQIDGVTRWENSDAQPDHCCWTPNAKSWFPWLENRWLLTPYRKTTYGTAGAPVEIPLQVRNDSAQPRTIQLALEFPAGQWPVQLSSERVTVPARQALTIQARATLPASGETRRVQVRATPAGDATFSTYSTLHVIAGQAPANRPLPMPLVLKPYQHENEQFGHVPSYPTDNQVYFDAQNRPYVRTATGISTLRDGKWTTTVIDPKSSPASTKVSFDRENRVYVLSNVGGSRVLHVSSDGGRTFSAVPIPSRERGARALDIEEFTGHNPLAGPPPIVRYTQTAKDEKLFWRSLNDLELFVPRVQDGRIVLGEPILVTKQCIGLATHSGAPASLVSRGNKIHIVWGEATDPAQKVAGVPVCAATYDRDTRRLTERAVLGYGAPANDIHNSPSITMDGDGHLHVLGGTHGKPFPYARSLKPNDAGGGWTEAVPTGSDVNQTYIGLVCTPDGTLHSVFRLWRSRQAPHPAGMHATLAYQRKRPGQPWEAPRVLVVSPFSEYSVFYHRLTIDRRGRLFVSYDYWSTFWFYRNDQPERRRALMFSPDGGESWKLPETADF